MKDYQEDILALFEDDEMRDFYRRFWYTYSDCGISRIVYTSNADIRAKYKLMLGLLGNSRNVSMDRYKQLKRECQPPAFVLMRRESYNDVYRITRALEYAIDSLEPGGGECFILYEISCRISCGSFNDFRVNRHLMTYQTIDDAIMASSQGDNRCAQDRVEWLRIEKWRNAEIIKASGSCGHSRYVYGGNAITYWATRDGVIFKFDEERLGELFTWKYHDDYSFDLIPFEVGDKLEIRPFAGAPALACRVVASDEPRRYAQEAEWFLGRRWWRHGDQSLREGEFPIKLCGSSTVRHGAPTALFDFSQKCEDPLDRVCDGRFLMPPFTFSTTSLRRAA